MTGVYFQVRVLVQTVRHFWGGGGSSWARLNPLKMCGVCEAPQLAKLWCRSDTKSLLVPGVTELGVVCHTQGGSQLTKGLLKYNDPWQVCELNMHM